MATDYRVDTNSPIRNGDAVVAVTDKVGLRYSRPAQDLFPASGLGGPYYDALDDRFLLAPSGWNAV